MARSPHGTEDRSVRLLKVGERVRHVLSELLTRQQVHDDTLSAHQISITEVRMSPDLRQARVYAKPLLGGDEEEVLTALRRNTAYLQREVAQRLGLKLAPQLGFHADERFGEAQRVERLPHDPRVARDRRDLGADWSPLSRRQATPYLTDMDGTLLMALALIPALIIAIVFHEVAHGWTALMLGDPTAKERKRLSLNPIRHVDPIGTLLVPGGLLLAGLPAFGWAK